MAVVKTVSIHRGSGDKALPGFLWFRGYQLEVRDFTLLTTITTTAATATLARGRRLLAASRTAG